MSKWPYNTRHWPKLRKAILEGNPFCVYCEQMGDLIPATVADHIVPVQEEPERALDIGNLQSLCKTCHDSAKASEEYHGYSKQVGQDGWPIDPRHPACRQ